MVAILTNSPISVAKKTKIKQITFYDSFAYQKTLTVPMFDQVPREAVTEFQSGGGNILKNKKLEMRHKNRVKLEKNFFWPEPPPLSKSCFDKKGQSILIKKRHNTASLQIEVDIIWNILILVVQQFTQTVELKMNFNFHKIIFLRAKHKSTRNCFLLFKNF